jgi:hypothetical protein
LRMILNCGGRTAAKGQMIRSTKLHEPRHTKKHETRSCERPTLVLCPASDSVRKNSPRRHGDVEAVILRDLVDANQAASRCERAYDPRASHESTETQFREVLVDVVFVEISVRVVSCNFVDRIALVASTFARVRGLGSYAFQPGACAPGCMLPPAIAGSLTQRVCYLFGAKV